MLNISTSRRSCSANTVLKPLTSLVWIWIELVTTPSLEDGFLIGQLICKSCWFFSLQNMRYRWNCCKVSTLLKITSLKICPVESILCVKQALKAWCRVGWKRMTENSLNIEAVMQLRKQGKKFSQCVENVVQ